MNSSNCKLITIKNISKNTVSLDNCTYLPDEYYSQYKRFQIHKDDLLIAMTGATIGKVGIYESKDNALLNQRNGIIRSHALNTFWLMNLLNTELYQSLIIRNSVGGAQPNISETNITKLHIPLPSTEQQDEIAEHIQSIRDKAKQLQQQATEVLEKAKKQIEKQIITG
jgi:type I restriction enzyme S subunit